MAQRSAAALALLVALLASVPAIGDAQALQRLTVLSFDLGADATALRAGIPFHLMLTLRVRERVSQIANIDLPGLAQLELLGDERETTTTPQGTQYRETVTVVAHDGGTIAISPGTLQAIDARDGKPKQWFSNGLTLHVAGAPSRAVRVAARSVGVALLWLLGIVSIAAIVLLLARRRPPAPRPVPPAAVAPPVSQAIVRTPRQRAQDALAVLQAERSRPAAISVRAAIWRMVGASDGETLADVLRRTDSHDRVTRELLVALERSAFTYEEDLRGAIEDACAALERYIQAPG
ncbi:MAG: hypothetical protein JO146_06900 [Candidatus Eremiobacteraeota bacterium]|nr:hypothetical protein [Candidatus Eremiobacteraeota bacterium]